ncbi:hypothetical protein GOBAR_DD20411 [Gossypium barbadense]|nr:hypothetical protein GOBAR_DD20411 [Gossypium barbadense]
MEISKNETTTLETNKTVKESLPSIDQDAQDEQIDRLMDSLTEQDIEASSEKQPRDELDETPIPTNDQIEENDKDEEESSSKDPEEEKDEEINRER